MISQNQKDLYIDQILEKLQNQSIKFERYEESKYLNKENLSFLTPV